MNFHITSTTEIVRKMNTEETEIESPKDLSSETPAENSSSSEDSENLTTEEVVSEAERDADFSALDENQGASAIGLAKVRELEAAVQENKEKYLRALADFENYKKRALKDRSDLLKYQGERVFTDLLDVIDSFERALSYDGAQMGEFKQGIELIYKLFNDFLAKWEVRGESAIGQVFDPNIHAALSQIPAEDVEPGQVVNELKKAYFYKDKLLRPAEVVVAVEVVQASNEESNLDSEEAGTGTSDEELQEE